ncbi:hypothetical protein EDB80DRAFT_742598 [Ilyonectria destructans]|nr:hypothetical protein EDB80DRAFT_742598 [Ilyonectria destructans]
MIPERGRGRSHPFPTKNAIKRNSPAMVRRPAESTEEVKARAAHNQVEQEYRKWLNSHFEVTIVELIIAKGRSSADFTVSLPAHALIGCRTALLGCFCQPQRLYSVPGSPMIL